MSTARSVAILTLGVAIGLGAGLAIAGALWPQDPASQKQARERSVPLPSLPRPDLESELAREKAALAQAEAERDRIEKELAAARARLGNASHEGPLSPRGQEAPVTTRTGAAAVKTPLTHPADILARVREIEAEAEDALKSRNGKKVLELIREAASLGKDAWPVAIKLGSSIFKTWEGLETPFEDLDMTEMNGVLCARDMASLYTQALESSDTDADFRRLAASYFRWTGANGGMGDSPERVAVMIAQLRKEQDESVASILASNIPREPKFAEGAASALADQKSQAARIYVCDVLADTPGDDIAKLMAKLAESETDPVVKRMLELGLQSRQQQSVSGFFLTYVAPKSQAATAGLQEGDIVTTYNGQRIRSTEDLGKVAQGMKYTDPVTIVVNRAGATQQVTVTGTLYQLGVLGRMVHSD